MNSQYSNGTVYSPPYADAGTHRLSFQGVPAASQPGVGTTAAPAGVHTLPPISSADYVSSMSHDLLGSRAQPLQPSLMTAEPHPMGQSTPVYGPTSTTFFSPQSHVHAYSQSPSYSQPAMAPQTYKSAGQAYPSMPPQSHQMYSNPARSTRLPDLRPMPINTFGGDPLSQASNGTPPGSATRPMDDLNQPIHVVGSQGRRGILPSVAGRPSAITEDGLTNQKNAANPTKDSSGKFPCEHCPKTYLHAKHLKRHMLRHTGVRPYTCGLCRDTFSRSDILKRHFQKCSARRGNPTGESHLTHSRANKKAQAQAQQQQQQQPQQPIQSHQQPPLKEEERARVDHEVTPTDGSQPSSAFTTTSSGTFDNGLDLRSLDLSQANFGDVHRPTITPMSRSNSKKEKRSRNSSHRGSLGAPPTSGYDPNVSYSTGHVTPDSITTSGAATPYTYPHETRSNQISPDGPLNRSSNGVNIGGLPQGSRPSVPSHYSTGSLPHIVGQPNGRTHDIDWPSSYHGFPQDDYGSQPYAANNLPHQTHVKSELDFSTIPQNLYNFNK